ncbi:MAG: TlpA family protein disulfide reductase [Candidatus Methylacidiphilales bacterium]
MKYIYHAIFIFFVINNKIIAQTNSLLQLVQNQSERIKSGSYTLIKSVKVLNVSDTIKYKRQVQFFEKGQNTICIIKDLLENKTYYFDTSKWVYQFDHKDSILRVRTRYNPNDNLLYPFMQPYGIQRVYPKGKKYINLVEDKISYTINDTSSIPEMPEYKNSSYKFFIDPQLLIPIKYRNYAEEWLDSVNFNVQDIQEEIFDVNINSINEKQFISYIAESIKSLPIKKVSYPEYEKELNKKILKDTVNIEKWTLLNVETKKQFNFINNNNPTLLYFTYLGCYPCKLALPTLDSIYKKWGDKINLYAINLFDNDVSKIIIYKNANKIKFNYLYNLSKELKELIMKEMGLSSYPTFIILDKNNKKVFSKSGYSENLFDELDKAITKWPNK